MGKDRDYKIYRAGGYYHVYNRGNKKQSIFLDDNDYLNLLKRLKLVLGKPAIYSDRLRVGALPAGSFDILSYCLMPNHFHFLIKQNSDIEITKLIQKLWTSYGMYFNRKYNQVGHLFQDKPKAKLIDSDSYIVYLSAYIHNNPDDPVNYQYSSFQDYLGIRKGQICSKDFILNYFKNNVDEYKKFVLGFSKKDALSIGHLLFEEE